MSEQPNETRLAAVAPEKAALEIEKLRLEVTIMKKAPPTFGQRLLDQWQGTVITVILGAFAAFPNVLLEKVKSGFDRVEQRSAQFEKISCDLSEYVFELENVAEFQSGSITDKQSLEDMLKDYNGAIVAVRRREHAYRAMIGRLWSSTALEQYNALILEVRQVDAVVHRLNPEVQRVRATPQATVDPKAIAPVLEELAPAVKKLATDVPAFLDTLK